MGYLFQYDESSFRRGCHKLNVRVHHDNEIFHLVGYELVVVQVELVVRKLEKREI